MRYWYMHLTTASCMWLTIFFFLFTIHLGAYASKLCPVSIGFETAIDLQYRYPERMYADSSLVGLPLQSFKCTHYNEDHKYQRINCLTSRETCPVKTENIETTMVASSWPKYGESLLRIQRALQNKSEERRPVNVFILGGSMTLGAETRCACVCASHVDDRCPTAPPPEQCDKSLCTWATFLKKWLYRDYPHIKWSFFNFAGSGVDSKRMAESIGDHLKREKVEFTDNDLIFIDHSVNDVIKTDSHAIQLPFAFELLIRRILAISYTNKVRPTIIVLEQYPHSSTTNSKKRVVAKPAHQQDYAYVYRQISEHYGLILWSIRDVYWSYFATGNVNTNAAGNITASHPERMYQISPFDSIHIRTHTPWYLHLFIADLLANCLLHSVRTIDQQQQVLQRETSGSNGYTHNVSSRNSNSVPLDDRVRLYNTEWLLRPVNASAADYELPPPLYDVLNLSDKFSVCNLHSPYLVDEHPNSTFTPPNVTLYENDAISARKEGWRQYIDYHDTPGWIINELSHPDKRALTFPIVNCNGSCFTGLMIRVVYLRSYIGMGRVDVHICGERAYKGHEAGRSTIDGLDVYDKVSVPTSYIHLITPPEAKRCESLPVEERTLQIIYDPVVDKRDVNEEVRGVHLRKFKLLHVQMCSAAPVA